MDRKKFIDVLNEHMPTGYKEVGYAVYTGFHIEGFWGLAFSATQPHVVVYAYKSKTNDGEPLFRFDVFDNKETTIGSIKEQEYKNNKDVEKLVEAFVEAYNAAKT